jgi:hypothetical protein
MEKERQQMEKERQQLEKERLKKEEQLEKERLKREEQLENERLKREEQLEKERLKKEEQLEKERLKKEEQLEKERQKKEEQFEKERLKREEEHNAFMKRMDRLEKIADTQLEQISGISRSNGEFCEEYFVNCFKENPTLFGEKFDRVLENLYADPMVINDEYDLVLRNGTTTALIEMKYKASTHDVGKMFSKLNSYRANYPMFKDYKIYLCLASFRFPKKVREKAEEEGVVLIEQRGEKIEVISENIRTW